MVKNLKIAGTLFLVFALLSFRLPFSFVSAQVGTYPTTPEVGGADLLATGLFALPSVGEFLLQCFNTCLDVFSVLLLYADSLTAYASFLFFSITVYPVVASMVSLLDLTLILSVITAPCLAPLAIPLGLCSSILESILQIPMLNFSGLLNLCIMGLNIFSTLFSIFVSIAGQFGGLFTGLILMGSRFPIPLVDTIFISLGRVVYFACSSGLSFGYIERSLEPLKALLPR